jgi:tRNA 2-thiouridine synthesizing protein D
MTHLKFSILVHGAPYSAAASLSALRYSQAVLAAGYGIYRVFFYHDGIYNANSLVTPPQDETNVVSEWSRFGIEHNIELVTCIASSLRRGVLDQTEAARYEKTNHNLAPGFTISGLGQLIDACLESDRIMTFGN